MRPDSLHHTTHYQMSDYRHRDSTERAAPDQFALQVWGDCWDDANIPRTDTPVRFNAGYRLYAMAERLGCRFAPSFTYRQRGI